MPPEPPDDGPADPKDQLPLTPLSFHILLSLVDAPRHGYGIVKDIEERTDGELRPATGTVYLAIQRLQGDGLLAESEAPADGDDDPRRRYYRLTSRGRTLAEAEARRLARTVGLAHAKDLLDTPTLDRLLGTPGSGRGR